MKSRQKMLAIKQKFGQLLPRTFKNYSLLPNKIQILQGYRFYIRVAL